VETKTGPAGTNTKRITKTVFLASWMMTPAGKMCLKMILLVKKMMKHARNLSRSTIILDSKTSLMMKMKEKESKEDL
jgi:hypothetical protein